MLASLRRRPSSGIPIPAEIGLPARPCASPKRLKLPLGTEGLATPTALRPAAPRLPPQDRPRVSSGRPFLGALWSGKEPHSMLSRPCASRRRIGNRFTRCSPGGSIPGDSETRCLRIRPLAVGRTPGKPWEKFMVSRQRSRLDRIAPHGYRRLVVGREAEGPTRRACERREPQRFMASLAGRLHVACCSAGHFS